MKTTHLDNYLATTRDGTPIFWGYKSTDDFTSPMLSRWVTIDTPKKDGSNYRRLTAELEELMDGVCNFSNDETDTHAKEIARVRYPGIHWSRIIGILDREAVSRTIRGLTKSDIDNWAQAS